MVFYKVENSIEKIMCVQLFLLVNIDIVADKDAFGFGVRLQLHGPCVQPVIALLTFIVYCR